ncbi:MAG: AsmA family protein [Elusimicrobium sp.]|uniref:AsmA family protein n=1 Tax=Candidatus Avelusimicrobium gallicola TaxID=2562704 RepID=A0A928DNV2_9BACT|nr:AsmA family protein [Elusimicrobium sp.]
MGKKHKNKNKKRRFLRGLRWFIRTCFVWCMRLFLFTAMLLLLLFSAVWLLFLRTFNAQHISEVITEELQKRLDRPVAISSLDLKFINTVELKGFYVLDTEGAPGQALLAADSVTLRFKLLPLLEQKLVIDEVSLHAPRFSVIRSVDGTYNIPQIKLTESSAVYTSAGSGKKLTVSVEDWTVKNGVLSFKDIGTGVTHAVYGLDLHFEKLRFDELSRFTMDMVMRTKWKDNISDVEIKGSGHVNFADFKWNEFALRSLRAQVFLFQKPVHLLIDLDNLRTPYFNVRAEVPAFEEKDLSLFKIGDTAFSLPKSSITAKGQLSKNYHYLKLSQATVSAADVKAEGNGYFDFTQAPYTADLSLSTNYFKLAGKNKYYAPIGKYKLTGQASLSGQVLRKDGKFSLPLFVVNAKEAAGAFYGFPVEKATGEFRAKNNFTDLYASVSSGKVTVHKSVFDKLKMSGSWRKGNLYAYIASCELNDIPLKMSLSVNNLKSSRRKIRTAIYRKHLDPMAFIGTVQDFVTVIMPLTKGKGKFKAPVSGDLAWLRNFRDRLPKFMPNFAGTLTADTFSSQVLSGNRFNAEFDFTGLRAGMKNLSGQIEARLEGGVIHQMEKLAEEQRALNVTFQPFIIMHRMERAGSFKVGQVLKDVPFTDMAASARFENGKMQINNAYVVGPTLSAAVSGWTDWVHENFDIIIWTMFTNTSRSGALAENLTDESGNPALAFRVSSSMLKPKLEMLRAKKTGATIQAAEEKGLQTKFETGQEFIKGEYHAKK